MKTAEQIKEYLKTQDWFKLYIFNTIKDDNHSDIVEHIVLALNGKYLTNTISSAFIWDNTPEGHTYWNLIDVEFRKWYNGYIPFKDIPVGTIFKYTGCTFYKFNEKEAIPFEHYTPALSSTKVAGGERTPEEIVKYLQKQEWFPKYIAAIIACRDIETLERFISGKEKERTFKSAFLWDKTPDGFAFWNSINEEFIKWYENTTFGEVEIDKTFTYSGILYRKIDEKTAVKQNEVQKFLPDTLVEKL